MPPVRRTYRAGDPAEDQELRSDLEARLVPTRFQLLDRSAPVCLRDRQARDAVVGSEQRKNGRGSLTRDSGIFRHDEAGQILRQLRILRVTDVD